MTDEEFALALAVDAVEEEVWAREHPLTQQ